MTTAPEIALSVQMPWAWWIAKGLKDIENRDWKTTFRGRMYIHAGKTIHTACLSWDWEQLQIEGFTYDDLLEGQTVARKWNRSALIGEVDLVDCVEYSDSPWWDPTTRWGFVLENAVLYDEPIPCRGLPGFFDPQLVGVTR